MRSRLLPDPPPDLAWPLADVHRVAMVTVGAAAGAGLDARRRGGLPWWAVLSCSTPGPGFPFQSCFLDKVSRSRRPAGQSPKA